VQDFDLHWKEVKEKLNSYLNRDILNDNELAKIEECIDNNWYLTGEKDFSVYSDNRYLQIAYLCFKHYSRGFMLKAVPVIEEIEPKNILDVGAGIGATTAMLAKRFENSVVYYQNLPGEQFNFAKYLLESFNNINYILSVEEAIQADLIIGVELFEHIKQPISLLIRLLSLQPKALIISNSFGAKAYGHFSSFIVDGVEVSPTKISKCFNNTLRDAGYKIDIRSKSFWNSRPTIWVKSSNV